MKNQEIIDQTSAFVQKALVGAEGGHDWYHTQGYLQAQNKSQKVKVQMNWWFR